MILTFSSDYHLGTRRQAHTTPESARRLKNMLYTQALVATDPPLGHICLGDMFDKAYNDETTLVQGHRIASRCEMVLSGNHDETNRESATTSLKALAELGAPVIHAPDLSTPYFFTKNQLWVVPHHASQALFEEALLQAAEDSGPIDNPNRSGRYLLLHCNYDVPFDTEDSTLNLTPEMAETLLKSFSRILIGHEHNPKELYGGRVVLVGNTHPTSFSDISDKFRWRLDTETDELTKELIWSEEDLYCEVKYGDPIPDLGDVQFVDVVGAEPVEDATEVAHYVRSIWEKNPRLLAVRNNVAIIDHLRGSEGIDTNKPALVDLKSRIHDDLEGSDLQPVYDRLVATAEG